jgi:hypothetical protein
MPETIPLNNNEMGHFASFQMDLYNWEWFLLWRVLMIFIGENEGSKHDDLGFLFGGLEHEFYFSIRYGMSSFPTDDLIFFKMVKTC